MNLAALVARIRELVAVAHVLLRRMDRLEERIREFQSRLRERR